MGTVPVPIYVSRGHFALRYEVPKFLPRGGHLCMAMLTIAVADRALSRSKASPRPVRKKALFRTGDRSL